MSDPLDQLQNPQPASQQDNSQLINTFNHADSVSRAKANAHMNGNSPEMDEKIRRLYNVKSRLDSHEWREDLFDPQIRAHARKLYQTALNPNDKLAAAKMASDENSRAVAHDAMGGSTSENDWMMSRDYHGRKLAAQMQDQWPDQKDAIYNDGVAQFDKLFSQYKPFVVDAPKVPLKAPVPMAGGAPMYAQQKNDIINMMKRIAPVQQQQLQGGPEVDPDTFQDLLR